MHRDISRDLVKEVWILHWFKSALSLKPASTKVEVVEPLIESVQGYFLSGMFEWKGKTNCVK